MTICEDRKKTDLKTDSLAVCESSRTKHILQNIANDYSRKASLWPPLLFWKFHRKHSVTVCKAVVLNLGPIEPLGFDGTISGVRRRSSETWLKAWLYHSKLTMITFVVTHSYFCYIGQKWDSTKARKTT